MDFCYVLTYLSVLFYKTSAKWKWKFGLQSSC